MTAPLRPLPVLARTALKATLLAAGGFACYWTYLTVNRGRLLFDARRRPPRVLPDGISLYAHEVPGGMLSSYVYRMPAPAACATCCSTWDGAKTCCRPCST